MLSLQSNIYGYDTEKKNPHSIRHHQPAFSISWSYRLSSSRFCNYYIFKRCVRNSCRIRICCHMYIHRSVILLSVLHHQLDAPSNQQTDYTDWTSGVSLVLPFYFCVAHQMVQGLTALFRLCLCHKPPNTAAIGRAVSLLYQFLVFLSHNLSFLFIFFASIVFASIVFLPSIQGTEAP